MRTGIALLLIAFSHCGYSQDAAPLRRQQHLQFNTLMPPERRPVFTVPPRQQHTAIPANTLPQRLPIFCALEKKLWQTCNVWIRIRLPEHPE